MEKRQICGLFALLAITAAVIGAEQLHSPKRETVPEDGEITYAELLADTPVAVLEGELVSPDGRFEVRAAGKSDNYVSGLAPPEKLQIVDRLTDEVLWEDMGYLTQSVLWSPDSRYLALSYAGRTWEDVKIFETDTWTSWDFTLPDGSPIPEYTFLPYDQPWGEWLDHDTLLLTVGRGCDDEEQHTYRCSVDTHQEQITGSTLEQTTETLPGNYDFDHDGEVETVELVTVLTPETPYFPAWYELQVKGPDGGLLWMQDAGLYHVGWVSLFACEVDGQDYLLRYCPWAGPGQYCAYDYKLFSLDSGGAEVPFRENRVGFDLEFDSTMHSFDPTAIAAFLEEVHGYLDGSTLLLTTERGNFRTGGSGVDFRQDMDFWGDDCPYDESKSLEENLRNYEMYAKEIRGIP